MPPTHDRTLDAPGEQGDRSTNSQNCQEKLQRQANTKSVLEYIVNNNNISKNDQFKTFGNNMKRKEEGMVRIVSQNIGCLGVNTLTNSKQDTAIQWLINNEVDICAWQEIGIAFHKVPGYERLSERIRDRRWNKVRLTYANNIHDSASEHFQWGGTAILSFNEAATRVKSSGKDQSGMGRWSHFMLEGKHHHKVRFISAYNPCKTQDSTKTQTVYNQQKSHLQSQGNNNCPRLQFLLDLVQQIKKWQENGELIVVLMDFNENLLRDGPLQMALKQLGLVDPIRKMHRNVTRPPPTSKTGSVPIDSIFVSKKLSNIARGGWLKLGEGIGDHRVLFCDVPFNDILGENPFQIHRPEMRRLKCEDPRIVQKFNSLLLQQIIAEGTHLKLAHLKQRIDLDNITKKECQISLTKIDNSIKHSTLYAEKHCRKLKVGQVPHSVERNEAARIIELWNNVIRKKRGWNISSRLIKRLTKKCNLSIDPMHLSLEDCEIERKLARKGYATLKSNSVTVRENFLDGLAAVQAAQGNETVTNAILRIKRLEELRASHRRIRTVTKVYNGATERVLIPDPSDPSSHIISTDKVTIEHALRKENEAKFRLAYRDCPFLKRPLNTMLGQTATNDISDTILNGTFSPPPNLNKYTKRFIKCLAMPLSIKAKGQNDDTITPEQSLQYWRRKCERTSSSYSGMHIGTYKASTYNFILHQMKTDIVNLTYKLGLTIPRWTYDLDVTLLKKPDRLKPSDMRTIGQLEADFNQGASMHFGKRMMQTAILHDAIPASQYSKPMSRSIEAALVKVMFFDHLRIHKLPGAFCAMDLMQCFDRMAHPVSSLCAQRLGVSKQVAKSMITTISSMKHYIRTSYGDSDFYYGGSDEDYVLQGAIQGNGAASPLFVAISCVLLDFLEHYVTGFNILTAITLTTLAIAAIMYVDDTDILISATHSTERIENIIQRAQKSVHIWRQGVMQTGGALRPEKCKWFLINFEWKNGKWKYCTSRANRANIYLHNSNGEKCIIDRLDVTMGLKGLGVHIAPDGNHRDQLEALISEEPGKEGKITKWKNSIASSYLRQHDVYISAFSSIFKSVEYILPATSICDKDCKKVDTMVHKTLLPRLGIVRTMSIAYRSSPAKYQGLGSLHTSSKQFLLKIKLFLQHANTTSQIGLNIKNILESLHLLMGINTPLFQLSFVDYGFLAESSWISHLWMKTSEYGFELKGAYAKTNIIRAGDFSLMEKLVQSKQMSQSDMLAVNRCRVYLHAQNLSDISTGNGRLIRPQFLLSTAQPLHSKYTWPYQVKPPSSDWKQWKKAVLEIWNHDEQGILNKPMGPILLNSHLVHTWYFSPTTQKLYHRLNVNNKYLAYTRVSQATRNTSVFHDPHATQNLPSDSQIAIVNKTCRLRPILEACFPPNAHINHTSPQYEEEVFYKHVHLPNAGILIANVIRNRQAVAVCDASAKHGIGAASWTMTNPDDSITVYGDHGVPPGHSQMDSYRAELYGIYAILEVLYGLEKKFAIKNGSIHIACDNIMALSNSFTHGEPAPVTSSDFDILWAIYELRCKIDTTITFEHVYGHRDKDTKNLTHLERLNIAMDKRAGMYRKRLQQSNDPLYSHLHTINKWSIFINKKPVTRYLEKTLQDEIFRQMMYTHLVEKKCYHSLAPQSINWHAIETASKNLTLTRKIWLTKFVSGFLPTATAMKDRGNWDTSLCPVCHKQV